MGQNVNILQGTGNLSGTRRLQPTLQIGPGYRFNAMVTKDLVVSPSRD